MRRPSWPIIAILVLLCCGLWAWNRHRFVQAGKVIRMDQSLDHLPGPAVARLTALGHDNTVARLRWIGSFPYFQYQLDARDDRSAGSRRGAFDRLYESLIALDPRFEPFYLHAQLTVGDLAGDEAGALRYLLLGTHHLPRSQALWANLAALIYARMDMENRNPDLMEAVLVQWAEAEAASGRAVDGSSLAQDWLRAMARRTDRGQAQFAYWATVLASASPAAPQGRFAQDVLREQLSEYGCQRLDRLVRAWHDRHLEAPASLDRCLDPALAAAAGLRAGGPEPLAIDAAGRPRLRPDPYGWPWRLDGMRVSSFGLEQVTYRRVVTSWNRQVQRARLLPPRDVDDIRRLPFPLAPPPAGGRLEVIEGTVVVEFDAPPQPPWTVEELLHAGR